MCQSVLCPKRNAAQLRRYHKKTTRMLSFLLDNSGTLLRNTKMYKDEWNVPLTLVLRRLTPKQVSQYVCNGDHIDTVVFSHCKKTNLISGQPPNTVNGRPDAAMDTMQLALRQSLRTLLFVIVRVSKNASQYELSCPMYYSNHCSLALPQNTKVILVWFSHSFSNITFGENGSWFWAKMAAMQGWCPATMWIHKYTIFGG